MIDPTLPPSIARVFRSIEERLRKLERSSRTAQALPISSPELFTTEATSYEEIARLDFQLTGSSLRLDLVADPGAGTMDLLILAGLASDGTPPDPEGIVLLLTTASGPAVQELDLVDHLGVAAFGEVVTVRIQAKRSSGSGAVGISFTTPPLLFPTS